jgi:SCY1-like protein 1
MPPEDYPTTIIAPIIKLFASPDRGTRMALLEHLPEYIDKLDKKTVSDKIFPHLVSLLIYLSCLAMSSR